MNVIVIFFNEKEEQNKDETETCLSSLWNEQMKKSESERHIHVFFFDKQKK